jgi:Na+/pantothenate symporter
MLKGLQKIVQRTYERGAVVLFAIFAAPIAVSYAAMASTTDYSDPSGLLVKFILEAWAIPVVGPIMVCLVFLQLLGALLSTADTYVIGGVNTLVEDTLGVYKVGEQAPADREKRRLDAVRLLTAGFALSIVPVLFIRPDWTSLFTYLFYSANGFVGPLVWAIRGRRLNAYGAATAMVFGLLYPAVPHLFASLASYAPYPGIVTVIFSLVVVRLTSSAKSEGGQGNV